KEAILPILKIEEELFKNIKKRIIHPFSEDIASSIILYGSYAKGSERLESDIDVMVIIKSKALEEKCRLISNKISQEFLENGTMLTIDVLDGKEFKKLYFNKEPSIVSIFGTGTVIKGKNLEELIK
ncbi:MAG: nucleotidyltransferase domain-containing protein, partial [Nanoarchaeota archaeon]|nr:nucleotidyltransferase domain-containing protein [Nanoarchaeota archaeon]